MLLERKKKDIERDFCERLPVLVKLREQIEKGLRSCQEEEGLIMKALYASLPLSDIANYSFEVFLDYVRHGIFLLENGVSKEEVPEEIFFNYVLHPRVNDEDIVACRGLFYHKLIDRVKGRSMEEAVLEINHWCHEQVTYQSSDLRTANALAVYNRSFGRCGEETVFTVTALRSVGIPARQVYVPRWSHCDDNHAWVEVYVNEQWHFLGACEPEPLLDKGWFISAASRAMLVHSKLFSQTYPQGEIISKEGAVTYFNETSRYAETKALGIRVVDEDNKGVSEAIIDLQILNEGELHTIARLITDNQGQAAITLGLGSIYLQVIKGDIVSELNVDTKEQQEASIVLRPGQRNDLSNYSFDFLSPIGGRKNLVLEEEAKAKNNLCLREENKLRSNKREGSLKEAIGELSREGYPINERVNRILINSGENYREVIDFLASGSDEIEREYKEGLLEAISIKDLADVKGQVLQEHYDNAVKYKGSCPDQVLLKYVMSPRIFFEPLTAFREYIINYFTKEQQEAFKKTPQELWEFINLNIKEAEQQEFTQLITTPVGALKLGYGSLLSKKLLFIAVCRTLGMPALLNSLDMCPIVYSNGQSINVCETSTERRNLKISWKGKKSPSYYKHWTLARWTEGKYRTLDFKGLTLTKGILTLSLEVGRYRLIATNRLLNGSQLAEIYNIDLTNEDQELLLELRETEISRELQNIELPEFYLKDAKGQSLKASLITAEGTKVLIWLDMGKEPTEHILNEIYFLRDRYEEHKKQLVLILRNREEEKAPALSKILKEMQGISVYYDDLDESREALARSMFVDDSQLPMIIITGGSLIGQAAFSGYNVGLGDKVLQIINSTSNRKIYEAPDFSLRHFK